MNSSRIGRDSEQSRSHNAQAGVIEETTPIDLLRAAHAALIGRYRVAISLGLVLAAAAAVVVYSVLKPTYVSTGILHIAPPNPNLSLDGDGPTVPPRYESFVSAQATLIASRAVVDRAFENETLSGAGWERGEKGLEKLAESLSVTHRGGEQLIKVNVNSDTPEKAQAANNAVLTAYQQLYGERNGLSMGVQESMLSARIERLEASLRENQTAIDELVNPYGGPDALEAFHDAKVGAITTLDEKMTDIAVRKADSELKASPDQQGYELLAMLAMGGSEGVLSPAQSAIQEMLREDARLQQKIERLRARGYGGRHPEMQSLKSAKEQIEAATEHRRKLITEIVDSIGLPSIGADGMVMQTPQTLERLRGELGSLRERLSKEIIAMADALSTVTRLKDARERIRERLDRAREQLQSLRIRSSDHTLGQVSIAQQASYPIWASSDRRTAGSIVAALMMFFAGIGAVISMGFFRTRITCINDFRDLTRETPLLGVFVDPGKRNAERDSLTAVAAHELRNTLFTNAGSNGTRVFAVTSAGESGNQTMVASGLGQSFAMAGYQTLLVDGDLANQFLTARHANASNRRGLRDVIDTGDPVGAVHRTSKPRLWLTPGGMSAEVTSDTISADDVSLFLDMALKHYDIIVIDAGSATRTLESVLFTAASDRTVLAVNHEESKAVIEESADRLDRAGAKAAGLIYTGAEYDDVRRLICERSVADAMYPDGLSRSGRQAPNFEGTLGSAQPPDEQEHSRTAAA